MNSEETDFILQGKPGILLTINLIAMAFSAFILWLLARLPRYEYLFWFGMPIILLWLGWELIKWQKSGIREMHISESGLKVFLGKKNEYEKIFPRMISDIHLFERGSRKTLTILLEKKARHIPGIITLYPGKKIQLCNDSFENRDFDKAVELIVKHFSKESE